MKEQESSVLSETYLNEYAKIFEKRYEITVFRRQEANELHNSVEWGNWVYECMKKHDIDGMLTALREVYRNYSPGKLAAQELRSSKNLAISLVASLANIAAKENAVNNELILTAADVCVQMCEETASREELVKSVYAGLVKMSDLMAEFREQSYHPLVRQAKNYIYRNLHEEILIKNIASYLDVSPEHLSRSFHQAEGISLKEYIINERVERACQMLKFTNLHVSVISHDLAFPSQSHFGKIFKKKKGLTPLQFRHKFSEI